MGPIKWMWKQAEKAESASNAGIELIFMDGLRIELFKPLYACRPKALLPNARPDPRRTSHV